MKATLPIDRRGPAAPELGTRLPWEDPPQVIDDIRVRRLRGNSVLEIAH